MLVIGQETEIVPPEFRWEAALYYTRINDIMKFGYFDFDLDDGIIRYWISVDVEDGELSTVMAHCSLMLSASMLDRYHAGLMKIIYGGLSGEDAFRAVDVKNHAFENSNEDKTGNINGTMTQGEEE